MRRRLARRAWVSSRQIDGPPCLVWAWGKESLDSGKREVTEMIFKTKNKVHQGMYKCSKVVTI